MIDIAIQSLDVAWDHACETGEWHLWQISEIFYDPCGRTYGLAAKSGGDTQAWSGHRNMPWALSGFTGWSYAKKEFFSWCDVPEDMQD